MSVYMICYVIYITCICKMQYVYVEVHEYVCMSIYAYANEVHNIHINLLIKSSEMAHIGFY